MTKLADLAAVLSGVAPKGAGGQARFVRIQDLAGGNRPLPTGSRPTAKRAVRIEAGDVLVAARGEGELAVRPHSQLLGAFAGLDLYLLRPDPERLNPDYLASFLNSDPITAMIRASASRGTLPRIPKEALTELQVPIPDLAKQWLIGRLTASMGQYEELAQKKFAAEKRWFQACLDQAFTGIRGTS